MKQVMCLIIILASGVAVSEEADTDKELSGSWQLSWANMYLGKPGVRVDENPRLETELSLRYGSDSSAWYGGVWLSKALQPESEGFGDEVDVYLGYEHRLEQVAISAQASYYTFEDFSEADNDQWALDLKLKMLKVPVLQPYVQLRYFGEVGSNSPEDGFFLFAGVSRHQRLGFTLPWAQKEQAINFSLDSAYSLGALGKPAGYVYTRLSANTDIELFNRTFLKPAVTWQLSAGDQNGGLRDYATDDELEFRVSFRIEF